MTDDLGMRKSARRRRATRRLTRHPIRVPADEVARQGAPAPESVRDGAEEDEPVAERTSVDMIDVDLEVDGIESGSDGPTSGVVQALPRVATNAAAHASAPEVLVMPQNVAIHVPQPAVASVPPPAPLSAPELAAASVAAPPARARDSIPPDERTSPHIRLADMEPPAARSEPPPARKSVRPPEADEPTRPRIELSEMVMSAVRASSMPPSAARKSRPPRDEPDVDTNPRIPITVEEDFSPVVVTRARVISDVPPAGTEGAEHARRAVSVRPISLLDVDELEPLELDDESAGKLELPAAPAGARGSAESKVLSKAPPPPPPADPAAKGLRASVPMAASMSPVPPSSGSAVLHSPAAALKAPPPPPPPGTPKKAAGAGAASNVPKRRAWWEDFFSDDYLHSVLRPTPTQIARQVDFIESSLGLAQGQTVLDVGCGLGLHALELARRGYLVVGLDLSLPMITRAAEAAQQEGLRINFLHTDLREIGFQGMFDAIVCVGTTFGFFDDDTNRDVLQRMCMSLKPGGKLLLDVVNRDHVIASQPNLVWFEGDGCVVMEESDFNYFTSRLIVKRTMMREDGRQSDAEYSLRLYALHELGQMMQQAGFRVNEVSGQEATRGVFFGACSVRIILLAERRGKLPNGSMVVPPPNADEPAKTP